MAWILLVSLPSPCRGEWSYKIPILFLFSVAIRTKLCGAVGQLHYWLCHCLTVIRPLQNSIWLSCDYPIMLLTYMRWHTPQFGKLTVMCDLCTWRFVTNSDHCIHWNEIVPANYKMKLNDLTSSQTRGNNHQPQRMNAVHIPDFTWNFYVTFVIVSNKYTVSYLYIYTLTQLNLHTINKSVVLYSAVLILEYYTFVYISANYHSAHLECPNLKNINRKLTFNWKKKNSVIHNGCASTYEIKKNETKLEGFSIFDCEGFFVV